MVSQDILIHFLRGECTEEELARVEALLAAGGSEADELLRLRRLHREMTAAGIAPSQVERAYAAWQQRLERPSRSVRLHRRWLVAAGVAVVAVLAGLAAWLLQPSAPMLCAQAPAGQVRQITLSDGSRVWLHDGAMMRYPEQFDDHARKVELQGEAYFEVAHRPTQPFSVHGCNMDVRVLGTRFCFRSQGSSPQVSLLQGSVQVQTDAGRLTLTPGQTAVYHTDTGQLTVSTGAKTRVSAVWHDGQIPFHGATMTQIAASLEAIYDVKVHLDDNVSRHDTYTGSVAYKPTVEEAMQALSHAMPISYRIKGNTVWIGVEKRHGHTVSTR